MKIAIVPVLGMLVLTAIGCGGGGSPGTAPSSNGSPPPTAAQDTTTITIGAGGVVAPNNIRVPVGSRVTMVNNDTRPHDMNSDPHPTHTDCPALDWGSIQPGRSAQSGPLTVMRTCGYHDHDQPSNQALQGQIQVQ